MGTVRIEKPLGGKAYGSIPHLPGSRMGPADHHCHDGQAQICTERKRDKHDTVIVQEKLDGSCVSVANIDGRIVPLIRAGYRAESSNYLQHRYFANWVYSNYARFANMLRENERVVGEWLAQAHGTRYNLPHEPFVIFDYFIGGTRMPYEQMMTLFCNRFVTPRLISYGPPLPIADMLKAISTSGHGAIDPVEGAVWRVERQGRVDFLAKYVRPDKIDGLYLPEINGGNPVWNWQPEK